MHTKPSRRLLLAHGLSLPWIASAWARRAQAQGLSHPALVFPNDFGAHPESRIEWWYITGELASRDPDALRYGFQITFFRVKNMASPTTSRLAATHILFAHAALTDVAGGKLHHAERIARWNGRPDPEAAQDASQVDTDVRIGAWRLRRQAAPAPSAASRYAAQWGDTAAGFALDLQLDTTQPVLLQGVEGWSAKSPDPRHYSRYYSQPHLAVRGHLQHRGRRREVQGRAWLDHEWSDALLDAQAVGWDWVGLNLDDGSALTVFRLRRADGTVLHAGGSLRKPGQAVRNFEAREVVMTPGRLWRSPATGARYPVQWWLQTPAGRHSVQAVLDAQELDNRASTGTVYWEGLSRVHEAPPIDPSRPSSAEGTPTQLPGPIIGSGYLEMTGYAGPLRL